MNSRKIELDGTGLSGIVKKYFKNSFSRAASGKAGLDSGTSPRYFTAYFFSTPNSNTKDELNIMSASS